jgi:PAS domain S-box-containing protein
MAHDMGTNSAKQDACLPDERPGKDHPDDGYADRESLEERLRLASFSLDRAAEAIFWISPDAHFTYANDAACDLLGYNREELLAMTVVDVIPRFPATVWPRLWAAVRKCGRQNLQTKYRRKDSVALVLDVSLNFLEFEGRQYACAFARDVTERKRAHEQLRHYTTALEMANRNLEEYSFAALAASRAKSEFLANMSHEIRTPLTAIMGYSELLLCDPDASASPAHRAEALGTILRNGKHLLGLINDILDLSKIEAGRMEIERTACDPARLVDEVVRLMQVRADEKRLPLHVEYAGPIPQTIHTDPLRLRQILINLVGNAIKFTDAGYVRISLRMADPTPAGGTMQFDVVDTGIGMSPEQIATLFQPFVQADRSTARTRGGTGLGLAICHRLAERLGGTVSLRSAPGQGTVFCLTVDVGSLSGIPMVQPSARARQREAAASPPRPAGSCRLPAGCRILLAEDCPDNQRLLGLLLRKAGAEVSIAGDGEAAVDDALRFLHSGRPYDVVLMDMDMPRLNGYQAARRLRLEGYRNPIVALTAHAMAGEREKCLEAGCDDYLTKPVDRGTLINTVARHCLAIAASKPAAGA